MNPSVRNRRQFHQFSNGIRIRRRDLTKIQLARYAAPGNPNLHEPVEEEWINQILNRIAPAAPVFLDVGAAVGYYAVLVKMRWPNARVIAIEALPRHIASFEQTLCLNGLDSSSVTLIEAAVAATTGTARFAVYGYGSHLAMGMRKRRAIEVEARRLEDILDQIGSVDLMKMDIQGTELDVLRAAKNCLTNRLLANLIIGTHGQKLHLGIRRLLLNAGYTILFDDPAPPMQPDGLIVAGFEP